jgi:hypothetical protein
MRHMSIGHEEIVVSDDGLPTSLDRTSMKRDKLPDDILIADIEGGLLSTIKNCLGSFANGRELEELAAFPNMGSFSDDHMIRSLSSTTHFFDDRVGPFQLPH